MRGSLRWEQPNNGSCPMTNNKITNNHRDSIDHSDVTVPPAPLKSQQKRNAHPIHKRNTPRIPAVEPTEPLPRAKQSPHPLTKVVTLSPTYRSLPWRMKANPNAPTLSLRKTRNIARTRREQPSPQAKQLIAGSRNVLLASRESITTEHAFHSPQNSNRARTAHALSTRPRHRVTEEQRAYGYMMRTISQKVTRRSRRGPRSRRETRRKMA